MDIETKKKRRKVARKKSKIKNTERMEEPFDNNEFVPTTIPVQDSLYISGSNLPPFDLVLRCYLNHYLKKLKRHMLPESRWKYLVMTVEVLHFLIGSGAFTLGLFLPPTYIPYNILLVSIVIIGWEALGYCFVTKLLSKLTGESDGITGDLNNDDPGNSRFLIPFSETILKLYGALVVVLSLFFYLKPSWSPFSIVCSILGFVANIVLSFLWDHLPKN